MRPHDPADSAHSPLRHRGSKPTGSALREPWQAIVLKDGRFASPYFHPDFCAAVEASGREVEFMVQRDRGEVTGILPFHRGATGVALPVGGGLNDAHGPILTADAEFDWPERLAEVQQRGFAFHACPESHPDFAALPFRDPSYLARLPENPATSYEEELAERHRTIARQGQKDRKLSRQLGPLRLEFDCRDPSLLTELMRWKSEQYRRSLIGDIFQINWVRRLLPLLHERPPEGLRGLLSVLFAGSTPVAMHFGLWLGSRLHYWYPVYRPEHGYGSPGTRCFLEIARLAPQFGIREIDFGYGYQPYKEILCNRLTQSAAGLRTSSRLLDWRYRLQHTARQSLKRIWFKESLKPLAARLLPNRNLGKFLPR